MPSARLTMAGRITRACSGWRRELRPYYEFLFVRRAGLLTETEFLQAMAASIGGVERTPGRKETSVEEASFDAWIKQYRPDENSSNREISYYTKGAVLGLLLDATIRGRTDGKKSLDDVMRTLWTEFAQKNKNYTPQDFQRVCEQAAGTNLEPFFARFVRGREELEYNAPLAALGLRLQRTAPDSKEEAYFGAPPVLQDGVLAFRTLLTDTPAWDQGVMTGDVLVAVDDRRIATPLGWSDAISTKKPGEILRVAVFRRDELLALPIKLGGRIPSAFRLLPLENRTDVQTRIYKDWVATIADKPAPGN